MAGFDTSREQAFDEWDDDGGWSEELVATLKRDAPGNCLLCRLEELDEE